VGRAWPRGETASGRKTSCWRAVNELESKGRYSSGSGGWSLKPTAFHSTVSLKTICGIFLASALALAPATAFAQHGGGGGHAGGGGGRAGAGGASRAPAARPSAPAVSHPTAASPLISRPIISRPTGIGPVTSFRTPLTFGPRFPLRPPLRPIRPLYPFFGTASLIGFGFNPFFPGCNPFWGFGCGLLSPYYGYGGYFPPAYPSGPAYPSAPDYPSDPGYTPPAPSATLQYNPPVNQYPSFASVPAEDLTASSSGGARLRNETLLYLKDGSVFAVASYTVSDGRLHFVTAYGEQDDVAVDLLDVQKTIAANAARGVAFTLTPAASPAPGSSAPSPLGPAPAPPGPITPAKP